MRVAVVYPHTLAWPKYEWAADGFAAAGHDVKRVRSFGGLQDADDWADVVVFGHRGAGVNCTDLIQAAENHKAVWVSWLFDLMAIDPELPLERQPTMSRFDITPEGWAKTECREMLEAMDLVFAKERSLLPDYHEMGINARYLDQGCPIAPMEPVQHREVVEWDVLVFGAFSTAYRQRRQDIASVVAEGFVAAWAGNPAGDANVPAGCLALVFSHPLEWKPLVDRSAVVLGVDIRHDLEGYWSDRQWIAASYGCCYVRRHTAGIPAQYPGPVYSTGTMLNDMVRELRADRKRREAIGDALREWAMDCHTYKHRADELLREVERWYNARPEHAAEHAADEVK